MEEQSATALNVVELSTVHTSGTGETGNVSGIGEDIAGKCLIAK